MKRYYFISLLVLLMVTTLSVAQITVKFQKPASWTAVSLYNWGASEIMGGWPGTALTATNGWYTYTFPASYTTGNLIFNNAGAGEQTEDYVISTSVCLQSASVLDANSKYTVTVVPCVAGGITVTFMKPAAWAGVNIYAYYGTPNVEPLGGWPGLALTPVNGIYTYTFDASITAVNVIFNENGVQTAGTYLTTSTCLASDGVTSIACTAGVNDVKETSLAIFPNPIINKLNFAGSDKIDKVSIHSLTGQLVLSASALSDKSSVDVKSIKSGVYFVSIDYTNGQKLTQKIIKL